MKITHKLSFKSTFFLGIFFIQGFSYPTDEKQEVLVPQDEEIGFYSNGSSFSPVITLEGQAEVTWTWADSTTSSSTNPIKDYGSAQIRRNSLKVTPWSALRRINIGYDAQDGGSIDIELVADQQVSKVENLTIVAPYLKEWCSSYNNIDSLDFENFTNIETIECFRSKSLRNVNLSNTPSLKRACFEENQLLNINLSGSPALEDLRGALNNYNTITFPNSTQNLWHICVRDNPQITNTNLFNNLNQFPNIAELFIWNTNQQGNLVIPGTHADKDVFIKAYKNQYSSIDLRGALTNIYFYGSVDVSQNTLTSVDISGCIQIKHLDLSFNKLDSETIDHVLKQVDGFGTFYGTIDLTQNRPPTASGLIHIANLEKRGWKVNTDEIIAGNIQQMNDTHSFNIYSNQSNHTIKVELNKMLDDVVILEVRNASGVKILNHRISHNTYELSLLSPGIYFFTIRSKEWIKTRKFISY